MFDECNRRAGAQDIVADRGSARTARLDLRPSVGGHLDELVELWADARVSALTTMRVPQPRARVVEMLDAARRSWDEHGLGPWDAIERESGVWVGRVGLWQLDDWEGAEPFEVGFEIAPAFWRRGFATEGGAEAIRAGFAHGLERIVSVTVRENAGSRATMSRLGLAYVGDRVWNGCDVVWYAIDRAAAVEAPGGSHARVG